jgi:hypothetical protein
MMERWKDGRVYKYPIGIIKIEKEINKTYKNKRGR